MVRLPLTAARATFALKAGEWFRRGRLLMVSPVHGDYRRYQAEIPLIALSTFPRPALKEHTFATVNVEALRAKVSQPGFSDAEFLSVVEILLTAQESFVQR